MDMQHPRIDKNPKVLVGKPVIKGTRISVEVILRMLGQGHDAEELAVAYKIEREDILACQSYAADLLATNNQQAAE